jgi:hypothetical protein
MLASESLQFIRRRVQFYLDDAAASAAHTTQASEQVSDCAPRVCSALGGSSFPIGSIGGTVLWSPSNRVFESYVPILDGPVQDAWRKPADRGGRMQPLCAIGPRSL